MIYYGMYGIMEASVPGWNSWSEDDADVLIVRIALQVADKLPVIIAEHDILVLLYARKLMF